MDIEQCPQCGGTLKIIAAIEHPPVITKTLTHLGLPARAAPSSGQGLRSIPTGLIPTDPPSGPVQPLTQPSPALARPRRQNAPKHSASAEEEPKIPRFQAEVPLV